MLNWIKSLFKKEVKKPTMTYSWQADWEPHLKELLKANLVVFSSALDIKKIRPDWFEISDDNRITVLVEFFKALSFYESGFNPKSQSVDVGQKNDPDTWSIGLLQLSVIDQKNLNIHLGFNFDDLLIPDNNFTLGIAIMCNQIAKRGKIIIPKEEKGNPGVYWATLNPGNVNDKSKDIIGACQKPVFINRTPWVDIALNEVGVKEYLGSKNNPRVLEYHKSTSLQAAADEVPWCSAFVTWCLEKAEYKSTKSAWARSYLDYGMKFSEPRYGAILIFSRGHESGHVAFYVGEEEGQYLCLGGNQGDQVCIKKYPKSALLGIRWPIKS